MFQIVGDVSFADIGTRQLTVHWKPFSNGNSEVINYHISLRSKFVDRNFGVNGSKTFMKFDTLVPGSEYRLEITAENTIGISNSSYSTVKTLSEGNVFARSNFRQIIMF